MERSRRDVVYHPERSGIEPFVAAFLVGSENPEGRPGGTDSSQRGPG